MSEKEELEKLTEAELIDKMEWQIRSWLLGSFDGGFTNQQVYVLTYHVKRLTAALVSRGVWAPNIERRLP